MPNVPPVSDKRLTALVVAALIAVLTVAATLGSPAAAATAGIAFQDERFQPQEMRTQPPFGARTALKPVDLPQQRRLSDAKAAR
jgi:hypothetical protein